MNKLNMQPIIKKFIKSPYPSEREKFVLKARFGVDCEPLTLEAVGKHLGVTRERVRQIESRALEMIKIWQGLDKAIDRGVK